MTSSEREQLLKSVVSAFLGGSGTNRVLVVHLAGHPELNVEISDTARGLRTVVGQGQRGRARALPVAGADAKLLALGFAGGGRLGNYRSYSTPTAPSELMAMIDQLMTVAFNVQPDWELEIASNDPGVRLLIDHEPEPARVASGVEAGKLGVSVIDELYQALAIDDAWSVRSARDFTWWPHRLAQSVSALEPFDSTGTSITRIVISTRVLKDVPNSTETMDVLASVNANTTLVSALVDPETETLRFVSNALMHSGNLWYTNYLKVAASLQAAEAERTADALARALGAKVDISPHPTGGLRPSPDEMLGVAEAVFIPTGQQSSPFQGAFESLEKAPPHPWLVATSGREGFTGEFNYQNPARIDGVPTALGGDVATGIVIMDSSQAHPRFGSGVLVRLGMPISVEKDKLSALANRLNLLESQGQSLAPLLGSWCAMGRLWFVTFIPAVLGQNLAESERVAVLYNWAMAQIVRSSWARTVLSSGRE